MTFRPVLDVVPANRPLLVGMVHLRSLRGAASGLDDVERAALTDAERLLAAGFPCLALENFGDAPFAPGRVGAATVAAMTRMALAVRRLAGDAVPLVINVLRNDAESALAIAAAVGAGAVRVNVHAGASVTDQGLIEGRAHETVPWRDTHAPGVQIWADVRVKHAAPLVARPVAEEAEELHGRGRADALIVSGARTGGATDPERARVVREATPAPVLVGSGATPETLEALAAVADGFIVGSWLKEGGRVEAPVDSAQARAMVAAVAGLTRAS
jgi:membrane complex biogenesis BtpA family protein